MQLHCWHKHYLHLELELQLQLTQDSCSTHRRANELGYGLIESMLLWSLRATTETTHESWIMVRDEVITRLTDRTKRLAVAMALTVAVFPHTTIQRYMTQWSD